MRKESLKTRLTLSYILVALICIFTISIITNVLMEKQFKVYTISNQERKNVEVANLISKQYIEKDKWNDEAIEKICVNAIEQGMILKVIDITNNVIFDATVHNNGACKQMLERMKKNMSKYYPGWNGEFETKAYPIFSNKNEVGTVEVGYYGPFYYNDNDIAFISNLNKLLISVGIFSLFFAFIIGIVMASYLSIPIVRVINTAENISKGYFETRVKEKSKIREINLLTSTVNNLAETLEKQESLRKRMSADVAHELRTPLSTLQGYMEGMIDGIWKPDTERLISCHEEIIRIIGLVGNLENLARYESDNCKLNKVKYDISEQIQKILYNFEQDFNTRSIKINFQGTHQEVFADRDKMSQVFINVISNALKYTPEGGNVDISVADKTEAVEIRIKDTGIGIATEDVPFIFERFYRADKSRNRLTGGSGIGLTIAKAIIDSHKGKLMVESNLNKGSEFIIALPILN